MFNFNPDNKVMIFLTKSADVLLATFFWMLGCIPIITAGTATCALYTVLWRIYAGQDVRVSREFFYAMKANLKVATVAWLCCLLVGAVILGNIYACTMMVESTGIYGIMKGSTVCFAIVYVIALSFLFPGIARYKVSVAQALRNSVLFGFQYLKISFAALVLLCFSVLIVYFLEWYSIVFIGPNLFLHAVLLNKAFKEYEEIKFDKTCNSSQ